MPAKEQQLRVDPADSKAYPLDSFLECYGEDEGQRRWASAGQQPACPGISPSLLFSLWLLGLYFCRCTSFLLLGVRVERSEFPSLSDDNDHYS